jgi:hypothetical protein
MMDLNVFFVICEYFLLKQFARKVRFPEESGRMRVHCQNLTVLERHAFELKEKQGPLKAQRINFFLNV